MSKRKKVSVIVANDRHSFKGHRKIVLTTATGEDVSGDTEGGIVGAIALSNAAGVAGGGAYIYVDTAGTGTIISG